MTDDRDASAVEQLLALELAREERRRRRNRVLGWGAAVLVVAAVVAVPVVNHQRAQDAERREVCRMYSDMAGIDASDC